jgi:hypothetical protein
MALRIICMCRGDNDELWKNAQGHMGVLHPELVGNVTREDLLSPGYVTVGLTGNRDPCRAERSA